MDPQSGVLYLKQLGIDTYTEAVVYIRADNPICHAEGFDVNARIRITLTNNPEKEILATLHTIAGDMLTLSEVSLSKYAWDLLGCNVGDEIKLSHPKPLLSLSYVRKKVFRNKLNAHEIQSIISDIARGRYSDIHLATFLTACAGGNTNEEEIIEFTKAMINVGDTLSWDKNFVVDKHCIGGIPGNRTTLIVVPIVAAYGLTIPKTSSRAITSPSGTADTMEVLAPVDLSLQQMKNVVTKENGCIVWGGAVSLSPADDVLIRVERVMDLDSAGQLVASVLSKKIAAGSKHVVIDIPVGPTAKIRTTKTAEHLKEVFIAVSKALDLELSVMFSEGLQPVGRGLGPALEARDVISVLQNASNAPLDLRTRGLTVAAKILEFSKDVKTGKGLEIATEILDSGKAWKKFQAICDAQGGMREIVKAKYTHDIVAKCKGSVTNIDNRRISQLAKLAGAPKDKAAGVDLHTPLHTLVEEDQPLITVHSETKGALNYALSLLEESYRIVEIEACE